MSVSRVTQVWMTVLACAVDALSTEPSAHAYCREVTETTPSGYDPVSSGCFYPNEDPNNDAGVFQVYWKNTSVGYSLQREASKQVSLDQARRLAAQAFAVWGAASCPSGGSPSISAQDLGPVDCSLVQYNEHGGNQNVIIFRDDGWPYDDASNTLGKTTLWVDLNNGEILDADMELNTHDYQLVANGPIPDNAYDLESVLTHEAGHFLGLAHSNDRSAVMYVHYTTASTTLTSDDMNGICAVYAPGGTRMTSTEFLPGGPCDPTPRNGFSTQCGNGDGGAFTQLPLCDNSISCSVARRRVLGDRGLAAMGMAVLGTICLRRRRRIRGLRALDAALGLAVTVAVINAVLEREARASVSVEVLFEELVQRASAVAVATPLQKHSAWERGQIVTYTRLHVDTLLAGTLAAEVWVRTLGGAVGHIGQIVEGEATFTVGERALLFLRPHIDPSTRSADGPYVVVERAQGEFPVVAGEDKRDRFVPASGIGALVPPSGDRILRFGQTGVACTVPRLAQEVLNQRLFSDAAAEIAGAWLRLHGQQRAPGGG